MTVAFKSPVTSANVNAKLISRTTDQTASGKIDFVNGIKIGGQEIVKASGDVLDFDFNSGIIVPRGTTRPPGVNGTVWYNSASAQFEGYENGTWEKLITPASTFSNAAVRSVTSTYTALLTDDILDLSGASFTLTIPTAVGNTGKRYVVNYRSTNPARVYTIATTGGELLGGGTTFLLHTFGQSLSFYSDGANWQIDLSFTETEYKSEGPIVINATVTAPTKGSVVGGADNLSWYRQGQFGIFTYRFWQTGTGSSGSGDYLYGLPANILADTTTHPLETGGVGPGFFSKMVPTYNNFYNGSGVANVLGPVVMYTNSTFRLMLGPPSAGGIHGSANLGLSALQGFQFTFKLKIADWRG